MQLEDAQVIRHEDITGGYKLLVLAAPGTAPAVRAGQFVHLRVPHMQEAVLRRPFSVFKTEGKTLSLLYKAVGRGTQVMAALRPGESLSLIGPLGHGFPLDSVGDGEAVLVAGGYGMAALYMVAAGLSHRGVAFFGGASRPDILCVPDFEALGWKVHVTTEDGSLGLKGIVTEALDRWIASRGAAAPLIFFACGPNAMLRAVGERAMQRGERAWISVDRNMGCGVGACLTCVVRVREGQGWKWVRSCREGPVFECREVIWENG